MAHRPIWISVLRGGLCSAFVFCLMLAKALAGAAVHARPLTAGAVAADAVAAVVLGLLFVIGFRFAPARPERLAPDAPRTAPEERQRDAG